MDPCIDSWSVGHFVVSTVAYEFVTPPDPLTLF